MIRRVVVRSAGCTWTLARNFAVYVDGDVTVTVRSHFGVAWLLDSNMDYRFRTTSSNASRLDAERQEIGTIWQRNYEWDIRFRQYAYTLRLGRTGMHLLCGDRRIAFVRRMGCGTLSGLIHAKNDDLIPLLIFVCLQCYH